MVIELAIATGLLGATAAGAYFWPHALKPLQIRRLRAYCRRKRVLVLSYDDGPGATITPALLELLAGEKARATFFPLGERAAAAPRLLDAVAAEGHEIGCHSQWHRHPWRTSPHRAIEDIARGYQALARWLPSDALFRPPCGKLTLLTAWHVRRRRAPLAWWTIDSGDVHDPLPRPGGALAALRRDGGGVVLLHDFDRTDADADERVKFVLETTQVLLTEAARAGLNVRRLGEVLGDLASVNPNGHA